MAAAAASAALFPVASPSTRDASSSAACACAAAPAVGVSPSGRSSSVWGSDVRIAERRVAFQAASTVRKRDLSARAEGGQAAVVRPSGRIIHGKCFVVGDNIDTDQIIPAEYLTLVPSKPEEYEKLGSYAMAGLPATYGKFMQEDQTKTEYTVVIGGANFGCGSSREHAPVALGAAGVRAVVAESYARIFFRNSVATGELYPVEATARICDEFKTGELVTVSLEDDLLINHATAKTYKLQSIGEAGPVIDAGGLFEFARKTGMIAAKA